MTGDCVSSDPDVIRRRRDTLQLIMSAERVLIEAEKRYAELRELIDQLKEIHIEGEK